MRRSLFGVLATLALLFCASTARAQTYNRIPADSLGYCFQLGAPGSQAISASCTVTVYDAGTFNLATIYSTVTGTPQANPFAAGTNGTWVFYGVTGNSYDYRISGGSPALTPYTINNVTSTGSFSSAPPYTVFGNCTGSTAAPTFCSIVNAMLTPPGADTQVIYNSSNLFAASQDLTWDNTAKQLAVRTSGSTLVRILNDSLGGKILFGTGSAPYLKDNTGAGWLFTSQSGQELFFGPQSDPQAFVIGGGNTLPIGTVRTGVGSHNGVLQMNDGSSMAGIYSGPLMMAGFDLPNTNHVAPIGSLYMYSGGGATTAAWLKESGSGNTGWTQFAMQDDTQTLTNKALQDSTTTITNAATPTKKFQFNAAGITATFTQTLASAATANRTATFPDASGTLSLATVSSCGTVAACSPSALSNPKIVFGTVALNGASPAVATITGISPAFTSTATYVCTVTDLTNAANNLLSSTPVSGSSFTITGPNTAIDTISWVCVGN
jgi:hypothetical protein